MLETLRSSAKGDRSRMYFSLCYPNSMPPRAGFSCLPFFHAQRPKPLTKAWSDSTLPMGGKAGTLNSKTGSCSAYAVPST